MQRLASLTASTSLNPKLPAGNSTRRPESTLFINSLNSGSIILPIMESNRSVFSSTGNPLKYK
jgi:hypothetical protein